jgi:hypothetical protein
MALKIRRGSDLVRSTQITPSEGELIYTTDTKKVFVGDGSTLGGIQVSGVNAGTAGTIPFYSSSTELSSGTNLTWNNSTNTLAVDKGSLNVNSENSRRSLISIDSHYFSSLASSLDFVKSKGTATVPTTISTSEEIGNINFLGYEGIKYDVVSNIKIVVDGAVVPTGTPFTVNFVSKTGTGPYFVTYSFVTQGTAPVVSRSYTIAGNENTEYNGPRTVQESTTSSMVVSYTTDPGEYGAGATTATLDAIVPGMIQLQTASPNGNLNKAFKVSSTGAVTIGAVGADFIGRTYDSTLNGQLNVISTKTSSTQTTGSSILALRTFADTTYGQSINITRSRGTVITSSAVVSGDQIGVIKWIGSDGATGTSAVSAALLTVTVDNTVSSGKVPGAFTFTTSNATSGALVPAVKIDSTQQTTFYGNVKHSALQIINPNYVNVSSTSTYSLSTTLSTNVLIVTAGSYTATINMPASPVDGQVCSFSTSGFTVTLTVGTGTVLPTFAGSAIPGTTFRYVYRSSNTTWYRIG